MRISVFDFLRFPLCRHYNIPLVQYVLWRSFFATVFIFEPLFVVVVFRSIFNKVQVRIVNAPSAERCQLSNSTTFASLWTTRGPHRWRNCAFCFFLSFGHCTFIFSRWNQAFLSLFMFFLVLCHKQRKYIMMLYSSHHYSCRFRRLILWWQLFRRTNYVIIFLSKPTKAHTEREKTSGP